MTEEHLSTLTKREAAVVRVLTDKRDTYRAAGQRERASAMSEALLLTRQVLAPDVAWPDTEPGDLAPIDLRFRADDSKAFLARLIDKLPEPQRQIMKLERLKTWTIDAIAVEMRMTVADVEYQRGDALIRLRGILAAASERRKR